jgi:hypothetical protein
MTSSDTTSSGAGQRFFVEDLGIYILEGARCRWGEVATTRTSRVEAVIAGEDAATGSLHENVRGGDQGLFGLGEEHRTVVTGSAAISNEDVSAWVSGLGPAQCGEVERRPNSDSLVPIS